MLGFFRKKQQQTATPSCMGLGLGFSFDIDPLLLRVVEPELIIDGAAASHIIQAVGKVSLDGTDIFRFYTDDEAFLQVVAQGGNEAQHVVDVKLFHYYDTIDVSSESDWHALLDQKIGHKHYHLHDREYTRVWQSASDYHPPVHMRETTYDGTGDASVTDQFTMLFERPLSNEQTESLFLSAEESLNNGQIERCFVRSTGITLSPSQLTING